MLPWWLAGPGLVAGLMAFVPGVPVRVRLGAWTLVILALVFPWTSLQNHSHWYRVAWVPFASPPGFQPLEMGANLALYVPFGFFLARTRTPVRGVWTGLAVGALLSFVTETSQVYSHGRIPSTTDLILNAAGAAVGAWLAGRLAVSGLTMRRR